MKKLKKRCKHDQMHLSAAILTQWRHPVASTKALDLFHQVMCSVLYRRTTAAIKMAIKVGPFFVLWLCHLLFPWRPLGGYGVSSCPIVVSSGFPVSPGHAASSNAICITPAHRHNH
jgi:hypothetical protein